VQIFLTACGPAHLRSIARALQNHDALAGLWIPDKNTTQIAPDKYRRCWPYHLAMKPFYHLASLGVKEKTAFILFPIWESWFRNQKPPTFDVAYSPMGFATEAFEIAEQTGALKVVDAVNSHPIGSYGFWQRECDLWYPGKKVGWPRMMFARANRELERADLILCPSKFVLESMLYAGIPESKCFLLPYGVNTSVFIPRTEVPKKIQFVCVGLIGLRKGQQYLFRAFEKVRKILPEAELVCVGGYYPDFKLEKKRWDGTFKHHQNIPIAELTRILRESTAFVFPSTEEGFAKAVIEGMASGLPIIATHESGATTLVDDGVEGFIVKARNIDQIANAMIKLATDRAMNQRMGLAAHARGAKNNSWDDFAGSLIKICGEAQEKRKNSA
jgi:glycosyltransferase involved in cell wall biosynthesis